MKKRTKRHIVQTLRWSVFIMSALTMGLKIAEAAAYGSLKIIIENPEVAMYSSLANSSFVF